MEKLIKKIRIETTLTLVTGLHIGAGSDNIEIGGIDNPVIKLSTRDNQPYIPGSSIKGKMRCLLEQMAGITEVGGGSKIRNAEGKEIDYKFDCKPKELQSIINLFGFSADDKPSKIIVRDALLTETSAKMLRECDNLDMPYTEGKWENVIHRVKGTAEHPRQTERIPAGVSFDVEFIINVWDDDKAEDMLALLKKGINALENDYLGGSGSRGYGQISFANWRSFEAAANTEWKMESNNEWINKW